MIGHFGWDYWRVQEIEADLDRSGICFEFGALAAKRIREECRGPMPVIGFASRRRRRGGLA